MPPSTTKMAQKANG